jgi:peptidoglycan/LPS O-acetylase OafA/YrhL
MLLYHLVEEPARRWMRRMVDVKAVTSRNDPGESVNGKLHPIDRPLEAVSVRAV